jgi:protoporphyrinogen oxidase
MQSEESTASSRRVAVVGGGMLGMAVGLELARQGHRPVVLEAGPGFGGLAAATEIGRYTWDQFYHVILMSDMRLRSLLSEVGLDDQLKWTTTKTGFFVDERFHYLSTPLDFLRFPPIGLIDKARLATTILRAAAIRNWEPLEEETAIDWLTRWSGEKVVDRLWRPLLRAKLGTNDELVSAAFIWAIIARMYGARKTEAKKEMFGYVEGGYSSILAALERYLPEQGVELRAKTPVREIRGVDGGTAVCVETSSGAVEHFDAAILTLPCPLINSLCPELSPAERSRNESVIYQGMICASLLTRRPLSDCYITNLADERLPFTAVIEMTALVDRERFDGQSLIYLPRYVRQDDPAWGQSDDTIEASFLDALTHVHPGIERADISAFQVARARHVLALSTLNYSRDSMPDWKTSIPGVYVANSAQIANGTLNVNETLGVAERILPSILSDMAPAGAGAR